MTVRSVIVWLIERNYNAVFEHVELVFVENKASDWLTNNATTDDVSAPLDLIGYFGKATPNNYHVYFYLFNGGNRCYFLRSKFDFKWKTKTSVSTRT